VIFGVGGVVAGGGVRGDGNRLASELNGMARSTARAVRLRACPAPKICLLSSTATSTLHLLRSAGWPGRGWLRCPW
jgi:hypothetical protein